MAYLWADYLESFASFSTGSQLGGALPHAAFHLQN